MSGLEGMTREELKALVLSLHETIVKQQETIKVLEAKMSFERELMATALPFLGKKKPQSVIARKISGGTCSSRGSKAKMILMSLFDTWKLRGLDAFSECIKLLAAYQPIQSI